MDGRSDILLYSNFDITSKNKGYDVATGAVQLNVIIENCNSIDTAEVSLKTGCLNIKYGPNGLGKSTIARAVVSQIRNDGSLSQLTPFKGRGKSSVHQPKVTGVDGLKSALVFDEDYVNQFAFMQDEVVKNSFEIFVKTPEYISAMEEIESLFAGIRQAFDGNAELEQAIKDLKELRDAFGASKTGAIPKNSKLHKAFGTGNKVHNVPEKLKPYESFIKSKDPSKWIGWQIKGNEFLSISSQCPYCSEPIKDEEQKETVLAVAKEYDATAVAHLNSLKAVIERLGKYFSIKCSENLEKVTKTKIELSKQEQGFLTGLKTDLESLIGKLDGLREVSFFSLRDVDISEKIERLKIDLGFIDKLDSEETRSVTDPINTQLEELIAKVGQLTGSINKHKSRIDKAIKENQGSINAFLRSAGYKYTVKIIPEPQSYKMKLNHQDLNEHVERAGNHLSFGEKNAFALVLFMHQVLSEGPDLVILDDPISSFDKNKKFAILNELFRGKASLKGRTALMLTHDLEPAVDVIKSTSQIFQGSSPSATFLSTRNGVVKEQPIKREDFQTFAKICKVNITQANDIIVKAIYLRRHYEILDDAGLEYNMLASLFKKRATPTVQSGSDSREMTVEERQECEKNIKNEIPDFDYDAVLQQVSDTEGLKQRYHSTNVGYEKIQLFRIIKGQHDNDIITKFINEAYHIENEYVMQLNPHKFEGVPAYIISECDKALLE